MNRSLLTGILLCLSANACATTAPPVNVVLIVADYMGYRDIEPYGADDIETPNLSRLAAGGVTMRNFYAAAPVCGPARAALYTGQYPARLGFEHNIRDESDGLSSSIPSLPSWLADAGYATALFGKWHLGYADDFTPNAHGFDRFVGHHQWTIGYYHHRTIDGQPGLYENDRVVNRDGYLTDLLTEETTAFIEENRNGPFFVTLAYNAALPPYQPPGLPEADWNRGWDVNEASRDDYIGVVERMDDGIGEVLNTLDRLGLADNTLVVYLYDHGGRHLVNSAPLYHGFSNVWEGGIRTHAILRLPGTIEAGEPSFIPAIAMDVTATILDVTGAADSVPDGISLLPYLGEEPATVPDRKLYWRADLYDFGRQAAVRDGNLKYVEHGNTQFLFDLAEDEGERHNLFIERGADVRRLRADLAAWQEALPAN